MFKSIILVYFYFIEFINHNQREFELRISSFISCLCFYLFFEINSTTKKQQHLFFKIKVVVIFEDLLLHFNFDFQL
jgi:hypothetical protein